MHPANNQLLSSRFPRASRYHPDWVIAGASGGANPLWLAEWLAESFDLRPGMRILDLGCGRALSSIFLRREFGVQVWACDLWFDVSENWQRIRDAGLDDVFPIHSEARSLPFAAGFFDGLVSIDSFPYYGTDDLYLSYVARFLKPGAPIGIAGAGLVQEIEGAVPSHLAAWWTPDNWCLHSADWWRGHWERSGLVSIDVSDTLPNGWQAWLDWQRAVAPDNAIEIAAVEEDRGRYLGYVRVVGRRNETKLADPIVALPARYTRKPLLRSRPE